MNEPSSTLEAGWCVLVDALRCQTATGLARLMNHMVSDRTKWARPILLQKHRSLASVHTAARCRVYSGRGHPKSVAQVADGGPANGVELRLPTLTEHSPLSESSLPATLLHITPETIVGSSSPIQSRNGNLEQPRQLPVLP